MENYLRIFYQTLIYRMSDIEFHEKTLEEKILEKKMKKIVINRRYYMTNHPGANPIAQNDINFKRQTRQQQNNYLRAWRAKQKALKKDIPTS
jgi:hypothetical protein